MGVWEAPDPTSIAFTRRVSGRTSACAGARTGGSNWRRTQELLRRELPLPPATVLDVVGGTGIHAAWLAQDGYDVVLVDVVAEHVEQAARLPGMAATVGDARALTRGCSSSAPTADSTRSRCRSFAGRAEPARRSSCV